MNGAYRMSALGQNRPLGLWLTHVRIAPKADIQHHFQRCARLANYDVRKYALIVYGHAQRNSTMTLLLQFHLLYSMASYVVLMSLSDEALLSI